MKSQQKCNLRITSGCLGFVLSLKLFFEKNNDRLTWTHMENSCYKYKSNTSWRHSSTPLSYQETILVYSKLFKKIFRHPLLHVKLQRQKISESRVPEKCNSQAAWWVTKSKLSFQSKGSSSRPRSGFLVWNRCGKCQIPVLKQFQMSLVQSKWVIERIREQRRGGSLSWNNPVSSQPLSFRPFGSFVQNT